MDSDGYKPWREASKTCFLPSCRHDNLKNPTLIFFALRKELKEKWCHMVGRNCPKRQLFSCADHINLKEDIENYESWVLGAKPRLKLNAIPINISEDCVTTVNNVHIDTYDRAYYRDDTRCFVPICKRYRRDFRNIRFFSVPKNLQETWCQAVDRICPSRKLYVCEDHIDIEQDCFKTKSGILRLRKTARLSLLRTYDLNTPSTPADRQKLYRERMKRRDPEKYLLQKRKNLERTKEMRKKISEDPLSEQEKICEKRREGEKNKEGQSSSSLKTTPLTPAEKQKRYRERMKQRDPEKYLLQKRKNLERINERRKKISEHPFSEQGKIREKRREGKRNKEGQSSLKTTPLTPAEKQKRYRERMKQRDPEKYLLQKRKDAERINERRKKVSEDPLSEQERIRKLWRESQRRRKEGQSSSLMETQPPSTPAKGQKVYRERMKQRDPEKYLLQKGKNLEQPKGKIKKISEYPFPEQERIREKWRENKRNKVEQSSPKKRGRPRKNIEEQSPTKMKLLRSVRDKLYRERLKRTDPEKLWSQKYKNKKKISEYSLPEQERIRKEWREKKRQLRAENKRKQSCLPEEKEVDEELLLGPSGVEKTPPWSPQRNDSDTMDFNEEEPQDPLKKDDTPQCRCCGEFTEDCIDVAFEEKPYLSNNKTTLAINSSYVELDFNNYTLPKTVCRDCDRRLLEIYNFMNRVQITQETIMNVDHDIDSGRFFGKVESDLPASSDNDVNGDNVNDTDLDDAAVNHMDVADILQLYDASVKAVSTHKRKSNRNTSKVNKKPKVYNTLEDFELVVDVKEEIDSESEAYTEYYEVSGTGTCVKTSELKVTKILSSQMAGDDALS